MKGHVTEIYRLYESSSRELVIPVYQRNYDWQEKQCRQLLDDLENLMTHRQHKHFFGAVVVKPEGSWRWIVIDGQQRLTTISLLMLALARLIKDDAIAYTDGSIGDKIISSYLQTDHGDTELKFKLKPVKDDADAYRRLFGPESEFIESSNVTANYRYFMQVLPTLEATADDIWDALLRLEVMHLDLEHHDDPQRIFESLNSTGLELSEADKVRNLVLMDLPAREQNRVYEEYWNRIEKNVDYQTDAFLRWYLVAKTTVTPRLDLVYEAFKEFAQASGNTGAALLDEVRTYSQYYKQITQSATKIPLVDRRLKRLNILKQDVILPFLLHVFADHDRGVLSDKELGRVLEIIESYLFRRFVCGLAPNSLNKIFATLHKDIQRMQKVEGSFVDVMVYSLTHRSGASTYPNNDTFAEAFRTRDFYNVGPARRRYLFECLENTNSNDTRDIAGALESGDISIEHVMPQTLTPQWKKTLGPDAEHDHDIWLHRIGNLTVTGYNSKYSNQSFQDKKAIENGLVDTPYRLNRYFAETDEWTVESIKTRGEKLTEIALDYWQYPVTSFEPPKIEHPVVPMGDDEVFTNREILAFEFESVYRSVNSWRDMLVSVLQECTKIDRDAVFKHAKSSEYFYRIDGWTRNSGDEFSEIVPGLDVATNNGTKTKVKWLRRLFADLDLDTDSLLFTIRGTEPTGQQQPIAAVQSEYEELRKYPAALDHAKHSPDNLDAVLDDFQRDFELFYIDNFLQVLGGPAQTFIRDTEAMSVAGAIEIRAIISAKIQEAKMIDPAALRKVAGDGSLATWVSRLVNFLPTA